MIVLHETGQLDDVTLERHVAALHVPPDSEFLNDAPLGKIPALVTAEHNVLYDSRVICEYLDYRQKSGLFPTEPAARFAHLRWQALADGLTDLLLLWRTELNRDNGKWVEITEGWQRKANAVMSTFEQEAEKIQRAEFGIGHVSIVCAMGQLDFRWPDCNWRSFFPTLAVLDESLSSRESVRATPVVNDDPGQTNDITANQLRFDPVLVHPR
jgi:glutathione S-transferase